MVDWYPKVRRRRQWVKWQACLSAVVVCTVAIHLLWTQKSLDVAREHAANVKQDLTLAQARIEQLDRLVQLRSQLESRELIVESLGLPVDVSRLLGELAAAMGESTSLAGFEMKLVSRPVKPANANATVNAPANANGGQEHTQQFAEVKITGIAPSTGEISQVYGNVVRWPFVTTVTFPSSEEIIRGDLVTREFGMSFDVPLSSPARQIQTGGQR